MYVFGIFYHETKVQFKNNNNNVIITVRRLVFVYFYFVLMQKNRIKRRELNNETAISL